VRRTEIKEETAAIKQPVTGDKRCAIRRLRRPLEICSSASHATLLVARVRQLVPMLDLFHQSLVLKNQVVPPCSIAETHIQPSNTAWQNYGGSRAIVVSLAVFTVTPFAFLLLLLQGRSAFLQLWMGKSATSSTSLGPSTELHGLTPPEARNLYRFLQSFILPCPTRRPRDNR